MSGLPKWVRVRVLAVSVLTLAVALACAGCAQSRRAADEVANAPTGAEAGTQAAEVDSAKAVEKRIAAAKGGVVQVATGAKSGAEVVFPQDALANNETIVLTPYTQAPVEGDDVLVQGFQLAAKSGGTLALNHPAFVTYAVGEDLGTDAVIVRYNDDGTFEELPTKVATGSGRTMLTAITTHFSGTGIMKRGRAKKAPQAFEDFNWVVYIKDTQKHQTGPMKQSVTLTLRAVNEGGDIPGNYTGNATIKTTNNMSAGGGTAKATFTGKSEGVSITITDPTGDLAPLTDEGQNAPDPLAPLTLQTNFSGVGIIKMNAMAAKGTGNCRSGRLLWIEGAGEHLEGAGKGADQRAEGRPSPPSCRSAR